MVSVNEAGAGLATGLGGSTAGFGAGGYDAGAALVGSVGPTPPPIRRLDGGVDTGLGLGAGATVAAGLGSGALIAGAGRVGSGAGVA